MYSECENCKCNCGYDCKATMKEEAPKNCPDYEYLLDWPT